MKLSNFIFLIVPFLLNACGTSDPKGQGDKYPFDGAENMQMGEDGDRNTQNIGSSDLTMHPVMDQKTGMVSSQIPLPTSWKIQTPQTENDPHIVGPGVKIYYRNGGSYMYSADPYMQQSYQMSGQQMRQPPSIEQYIQQDLAPQASKLGLRFVKQYPIPAVVERNRTYSAKLFKAIPSQDSFYAMGTEWVNKDGEPAFMLVNLTVSQGQQDVFWYANMQILEAEKTHFANAKMALVNGIVNTQDNPQQLQAYNANEQQRTNQSWSQHNSKMQQNQQNFDQQQATHRSTWDAVNNASMNAYNSRNAASDRNQQQFTNYINDENTVTNPHDGQQYQVQSGADQTWMNNSGEYIQSNDAFYNPNADNGVNNSDWQEVQTDP